MKKKLSVVPNVVQMRMISERLQHRFHAVSKVTEMLKKRVEETMDELNYLDTEINQLEEIRTRVEDSLSVTEHALRMLEESHREY